MSFCRFQCAPQTGFWQRKNFPGTVFTPILDMKEIILFQKFLAHVFSIPPIKGRTISLKYINIFFIQNNVYTIFGESKNPISDMKEFILFFKYFWHNFLHSPKGRNKNLEYINIFFIQNSIYMNFGVSKNPISD